MAAAPGLCLHSFAFARVACGGAVQVESTLSLQAMQPRVKELQAKYADDPETLQLETARMYKEAGAPACLPACLCSGLALAALPPPAHGR